MAESPPHRLGQIIGSLLEEILESRLSAFVGDGKLFLDKHGERKPVRAGLKLSWEDDFGNSHDLDFVIEKAGSLELQGRPVAFIEAAWRRYTKHSRNKAQEIQGAILPIAEKHRWDKPFLGAVLAGEFTKPSIEQLQSNGFEVLYLPYETIVTAFDYIGINARFDEKTSDRDFKRCVDSIEALDASQRERLKDRLVELNQSSIDHFFAALSAKLDRLIERIVILPLFGDSVEFGGIEEAVAFVNDFSESSPAVQKFQKFELIVSFSNGDKIEALFSEKARAIAFLEFISK